MRTVCVHVSLVAAMVAHYFNLRLGRASNDHLYNLGTQTDLSSFRFSFLGKCLCGVRSHVPECVRQYTPCMLPLAPHDAVPFLRADADTHPRCVGAASAAAGNTFLGKFAFARACPCACACLRVRRPSG